jgi:tRNA(fMet)-specific endonuclease VapC
MVGIFTEVQDRAHDLIIAATARATGRTLITTDGRARFEELPGASAP